MLQFRATFALNFSIQITTEMCDYTVNKIDKKYAEILNNAFGVDEALVEFNPGQCLLPPHHARIAQEILDAPVREDDIWLLSFPRTGSTWCQEMIWLLGNDLNFETAKNTIQQIRAPLIEMSTPLIEFHETLGALVENSVSYVNSLRSPRFIKSHLPLSLLPKEMEQVKPKIIYTCRNPKDVCVSYYHHCKLVHHMKLDFEIFSDLFIKGFTPLGPIFPYYLTFWRKRNESNILFLKYEDMKMDLKGTIKQVSNFLGKNYTEEQYDDLCEFLSFDKMRNNPGCNLETLLDRKNGKDFFKRSGLHFIRKGQIGDWKNYMSKELAKRFDEWIEENIRGTGLTFE